MKTETDIGSRGGAATRPAPALRLVESASAAGQALVDMRLPLAQAVVIGRSPGDKGLTIADPKLSSRHVSIFSGAGDALHYLDHDSKNGTYVNGQRVTSGRLEVGDVLRCGSTLFVVVADDPSATIDEAPEADRVGQGAAIQACWARARAAAAHDVAVLVLGESGTGKEAVARLVHTASGRGGPFVAVNCAALGGETATSALFGHERGAFTGAIGQRKGFFGEAERGTLFLDEIGDLPLDVQPRLLRALEQKEVVPLGAARASRVNVRVIAATNADLSRKIVAGQFRGDLYARLAAWIVEVPPLAARREDVLRIARHFAGRSPRGRSALDATPLFDVELAERLLMHPWPYNVRELRQLVLALRVSAEPPWDVDDLPENFAALDAVVADASEDTVPQPPRRARMRTRPDRDQLVQVLEAEGYNVSAVARFFDRDRKQIYRWAERYGIALSEDS